MKTIYSVNKEMGAIGKPRILYFKNPHTSEEHSHSGFFEFILVTKGEIVHTINGISLRQLAGTLTFIHEQDVHSIVGKMFEFSVVRFFSEDYQKVTNYLDIETEMEIIQKDNTKKNISAGQSKLDEWMQRFSRLQTSYKTESESLFAKELLVELFCELIRSKRSRVIPFVPDWLAEAKSLMDQLLTEIPGNSDYFRLLSLTKTQEHFSRSFKKYYNLSPTQYIQNEKLRQVTFYLKNSGFSVAEIQRKLGFDNPVFFFRLFKQRFKMTPLEYRESGI